MKKNKIGIYKITNPNNGIYIGQSVNIHDRLSKYKKLNCKSQPKLYRSFLKHGFDNHIFEIICECEVDELNKKERYYQELFNCIDKGLNCMFQRTDNKRQLMSEETKIKISKSTKGKIFSSKTKLKISISLTGVKKSKEHAEKIAKLNKNKTHKKYSDEVKLKMSLFNKNSRIILDKNTGVFYDSSVDLSNCLGIKYTTVNSWLSGQVIKNTQYVRV